MNREPTIYAIPYVSIEARSRLWHTFCMKYDKDSIVHSSVVTAFTIAAALIWKDVFTEIVNAVLPPADHLLAQIVSALIATVLIILALKLFLSGEKKAEKVLEEVEEMMEHHESHHHRE